VGGLVPDFDEDFLHEVIDVRVVVHDASDDGAEQRAMALEEKLKGFLVLLLDSSHQSLVVGLGGGDDFGVELVMIEFVEHADLYLPAACHHRPTLWNACRVSLPRHVW
jgi:hypothetical protein